MMMHAKNANPSVKYEGVKVVIITNNLDVIDNNSAESTAIHNRSFFVKVPAEKFSPADWPLERVISVMIRYCKSVKK